MLNELESDLGKEIRNTVKVPRMAIYFGLKNFTLNLLVIIALIFSFTQVSDVAANEAPAPIKEAMIVYKNQGWEEFLRTLLIGSPLQKDPSIYKKAEVISKIESYYGKFVDYEITDRRSVSSRVELVYYVMHYEKGPLFGVVTLFKRGDVEIVTRFNFHTEALKIIPADIIFSQENP